MSDYSEASSILQFKTARMLDHIRRGNRFEALREWERLEEAMLVIRNHVKNMPDRMTIKEAMERFERIPKVEVTEETSDE